MKLEKDKYHDITYTQNLKKKCKRIYKTERLTDIGKKHLWLPEDKRRKAGGEGDDRGCDGWMVSLTLWT